MTDPDPIIFAPVDVVFIGGPKHGERMTIASDRHYFTVKASADAKELQYHRTGYAAHLFGGNSTELRWFFQMPGEGLGAVREFLLGSSPTCKTPLQSP